MGELYKRTKTDSPLKCPYCGKQFRMTMDRYLSYRRTGVKGPTEFPLALTECNACGKRFRYMNVTAQYARENDVRATYRLEELCTI